MGMSGLGAIDNYNYDSLGWDYSGVRGVYGMGVIVMILPRGDMPVVL